MKRVLLYAAAAICLLGCARNEVSRKEMDGYVILEQSRGRNLGFSPESGLMFIEDKGLLFKDLDRDGQLDVYEDWRKPFAERARDLASKMSVEQIAGLMLYSPHQAVDYGPEVTGPQGQFLKDDNVRSVLVVRLRTPESGAIWNNNMQALVEGIGMGIPVTISSDPRNETKAVAEYNAGSGGKISLWPVMLGMAATFDPELVQEFGRIASSEYRALGIATALSPQMDLATDPRWNRFYGTFGESRELCADMARAYIDGFQTSEGEDALEDGWGYASVSAMCKHWPGGGSGEGGRDAHFFYGKYAVYPGNDLEDGMWPFLSGAFRLDGPTAKAAAVMPYYTISYGQNPSGENVGNNYSSYIINDLLRVKYGYDGVVCTDWCITWENDRPEEAWGKPWGMETASIEERHFKAIEAGVDQFGGNCDAAPVIAAYRMWEEKYGAESARERFERSAVRLLLPIFRTGQFENPYCDPAKAAAIVGNPDYMKAGFEAQIKSVVMAKNAGAALPAAKGSKVYIPSRTRDYETVCNAARQYFEVVSNAAEADFALLCINAPDGGVGYDFSRSDSGYLPISLQYRPYCAEYAREVSVAGGDPLEDFSNRSYKGRSVTTANEWELDMLEKCRAEMEGKPVVTVMALTRPTVVSEVEPLSNALLLSFGVQYQAVMELICGNSEPSALLPMQMPASMKSVEEQFEDVPFDMEPYTDSEGNQYDFAFGLNFSGVIKDARTEKYARR
ncbi:MAG: glycoside hydrolase family 3 C-terminal domain-containing protein [Bacteroidales bacterium]|nr:glycoside hydrolase family 3 C-terminal domain-containing protein [Bacteroidales bacterium]